VRLEALEMPGEALPPPLAGPGEVRQPAKAEPEPEPAPAPAAAPAPPPATPTPQPAAKEKGSRESAAALLAALRAVGGRFKVRKGVRPGAAAGALAEVADAVAAHRDALLTADESSTVFTAVEAALQRVCDDCTPRAAASLRTSIGHARRLSRHALSGLSPNQRTKLRSWEGRLAALARAIERSAAAAPPDAGVAEPPEPLALQLGREVLDLYLLRAPKPADSRRQENVLSRLRRALASATRNDPAAAVHVFGSAASGFGSSSSDIDVCLQLPREQAR